MFVRQTLKKDKKTITKRHKTLKLSRELIQTVRQNLSKQSDNKSQQDAAANMQHLKSFKHKWCQMYVPISPAFLMNTNEANFMLFNHSLFSRKMPS